MPEKISVRKMRRVRAVLAKHYKLPHPPDPQPTLMEAVVMTILWEDAPPARARLAFAALTEEFADWNEVRVSLASEVASVLESCGVRGDRSPMLKRVLAKCIEDFYSFELERLLERPPAAQRAWFHEVEGLPHYMIAAILYQVFGYDGVLASPDEARVVRRMGLVSEQATEAAIEQALTVVVPAKEAHLVYRALRQHARTVCTATDFDCTKCPLQPECGTGKERVAALAAAEAQAKAEARAQAKAAARAKAKAKSKAKPKAAKSKAKSPAKRTRKQAKTKRAAKPTAKPKTKAEKTSRPSTAKAKRTTKKAKPKRASKKAKR